jgi:predicted O-methyltransferase YrrM
MSPQQITLSIDIVNKTDLTELFQYIDTFEQNKQYFNLDAGKEHYKLLAFFAKNIKTEKPLIDIGTYYGFSAAALSTDTNKKVISYDIYDWIPDDKITVKNRKNIELRCGDCLDEIEILLDSDFICIDVSPHDSIQEAEMFSLLKKYKYKGLLFLDNIRVNNEMEAWWNNISLPKLDLTKYGHFSGSGIVIFDSSRFEILLE